jgi:hypothetical protein
VSTAAVTPGPDQSPDQPGTAGGTGPSRSRVLAFYLPQFHPIPENDEWWEPGFTEWTNVARAKPLFPGHYQPHLPGELGYYDLRVPEVREQQAALARQFGISGFVYYHYWFHGRRLLERPFDEVLNSGRPDFPFALCWANEEWTRNWDAQSGSVLVGQRFSQVDDLAHIRWLVRAFADDRYIKIDGRPLMLVYRSDLLPDPKATADLWRAETQAAGFPNLYLAMVESRQKNADPRPLGFDATVGFRSDAGVERVNAPPDAYRDHVVLDYETTVDAALRRWPTPWKRFPGVMAGWDNTARRPSGAEIFQGATPQAYERWLRRTIESVSDVRDEENLIFVTAWNEWAEGNHLEPDRHYGRAYLEATRRALGGAVPAGAEPVDPSETAAAADGGDGPETLDADSAAGHAFRLVRDVMTDRRRVVEIGTATPGVAAACAGAGIDYEPIDPDTGDSPEETLLPRLEEGGDPGALLLSGALERWPEPHRLLAALSNWACDHGSPPLVVSVANIAHFDTGLLLLCGRWDPAEADAVRSYTRPVLERLFERCGWAVVAGDDHTSGLPPLDPAALAGELPEAMTGALVVLAEAYNPDWAVEHFVWALRPVGVDQAPASYADAVGGPAEPQAEDRASDAPLAVSRYFSSIGLLSGPTHARMEDQLRRNRTQTVRKKIRRALVEFALPERWAEELPLLADTVDDLAELYLFRSDMVTQFGNEETFDATRYVEWAINDQPMVAAAVDRLSAEVRREATEAIRTELSASTVDRDKLDAATDVLADLYVGRFDLRYTVGNGTAVDAAKLLAWAAATDESTDSAAARLAPYLRLIDSALNPPAAPPAKRRPGLPYRSRP